MTRRTSLDTGRPKHTPAKVAAKNASAKRAKAALEPETFAKRILELDLIDRHPNYAALGSEAERTALRRFLEDPIGQEKLLEQVIVQSGDRSVYFLPEGSIWADRRNRNIEVVVNSAARVEQRVFILGPEPTSHREDHFLREAKSIYAAAARSPEWQRLYAERMGEIGRELEPEPGMTGGNDTERTYNSMGSELARSRNEIRKQQVGPLYSPLSIRTRDWE